MRQFAARNHVTRDVQPVRVVRAVIYEMIIRWPIDPCTNRTICEIDSIASPRYAFVACFSILSHRYRCPPENGRLCHFKIPGEREPITALVSSRLDLRSVVTRNKIMPMMNTFGKGSAFVLVSSPPPLPPSLPPEYSQFAFHEMTFISQVPCAANRWVRTVVEAAEMQE